MTILTDAEKKLRYVILGTAKKNSFMSVLGNGKKNLRYVFFGK